MMLRPIHPRLLLGSAFSATMTLAILYLMLSLIASGNSVVTESTRHGSMDIVRVKPDEAPPPPPPRVTRPSTPEVPPSMPPPGHFTPNGVSVSVGPGIAVPPKFNPRGLQLSENSEPMPLVKPRPQYPRRALERGLEGWVIVQYTITSAGTTVDVRIVESSNPLFDKAAVNAAGQFRYKARYVDGQAVATPGVRNRFTFELEGN